MPQGKSRMGQTPSKRGLYQNQKILVKLPCVFYSKCHIMIGKLQASARQAYVNLSEGWGIFGKLQASARQLVVNFPRDASLSGSCKPL